MQLARVGLALAAAAGGVIVGSRMNAGGEATTATSGTLIGGGLATAAVSARTASTSMSSAGRALGMAGIGAGAFFAGMGASILFGGGDRSGDVDIQAPGPFGPSPAVPTIPQRPAGYALDDVIASGHAGQATASGAAGTDAPAGTPDTAPEVIEEESETYGPNGEWLGTEHGTLER